MLEVLHIRAKQANKDTDLMTDFFRQFSWP